MVTHPTVGDNHYATSSCPSLLVIGLGPAGVEASLALAEAGNCSLALGDDVPATQAWRDKISCLTNDRRCSGGLRRGGGGPDSIEMGSPSSRSQVMAAVLSTLGNTSVRALSPVANASVVEQFDAVVMVDPLLPHAVAFNEHVSTNFKLWRCCTRSTTLC